MKSTVNYLGHVISENTVRLLADGLTAVRDFSTPTSQKQVRQFLGKINYYHKFIKNCAEMLNPLHKLLRKGTEFIWSSECQQTFNNLKEMLCSGPILQIFDHCKDIYIETDASNVSNELLGTISHHQKEPTHVYLGYGQWTGGYTRIEDQTSNDWKASNLLPPEQTRKTTKDPEGGEYLW